MADSKGFTKTKTSHLIKESYDPLKTEIGFNANDHSVSAIWNMTEHQVNDMPTFRYKKVQDHLKCLESRHIFLSQQVEKVALMDQAREFHNIKKDYLRNEHTKTMVTNKQQRLLDDEILHENAHLLKGAENDIRSRISFSKFFHKAKKDGEVVVNKLRKDQINLEKEKFKKRKAVSKYHNFCEIQDHRKKNQFNRFVKNLDLASQTIEKKHCFPSDHQIRKIAVNQLSGFKSSHKFNLRGNANITANRNLYMLNPKDAYRNEFNDLKENTGHYYGCE